MTRKERVISAITHQETDIVPYNVMLTQQEYERVAEYTGDPGYLDQIGNHMACFGYGDDLQELEPGSGFWKDSFGVVWNKNGADKDIGMIEGQVLPKPSLGDYEFPQVNEALLRSELEHFFTRTGDRCTVFMLGFSMFERAWTLRGIEQMLMDMVMETSFARDLFDAICEHNLKIINIALDYPFDGFHFGDDWGQQKGTIMGPAHWRSLIKPRIARMYDRIKRTGKFVSQHSCGDIQDLFPDLIDIGLDVYQTFQPEIYDIASVKREYGGHLTFWGGISTQRLLPVASPDEVKRVTRETIAVMGRGGGYIAAPTHDVPADVPPENIVAMVDAFHNQ